MVSSYEGWREICSCKNVSMKNFSVKRTQFKKATVHRPCHFRRCGLLAPIFGRNLRPVWRKVMADTAHLEILEQRKGVGVVPWRVNTWLHGQEEAKVTPRPIQRRQVGTETHQDWAARRCNRVAMPLLLQVWSRGKSWEQAQTDF